MHRYTKRIDEETVGIVGCDSHIHIPEEDCEALVNAIFTLADYEDLGYTPEELREILDKSR